MLPTLTNSILYLGTAISCIAPAGSFNEDARVTLKFNDDDTIVVHSTITYHYGPVVTTVTPGCSAIIGGTVLTITGTNFDDPVIAPNANPLQPPEVFFSFTGAPQRYNGTNVVFDPTTNNNPNNPTQPNIRVTTPRIDNADVFGLDVNLFIHFKGVNSKVYMRVHAMDINRHKTEGRLRRKIESSMVYLLIVLPFFRFLRGKCDTDPLFTMLESICPEHSLRIPFRTSLIATEETLSPSRTCALVVSL